MSVRLVRDYLVAWPLLIWAFLLLAGADPVSTVVPYLLAQFAVVVVHVRRQLEDRRRRRR